MPQIICPICDNVVKRSDYLREEFKNDPDAYFAANLVCHYRHAHLKSYDYAWKNRKDKKTGYHAVEHEEFRTKANQQAKKDLIDVLAKKKNWSIIRGFLKLKDNDAEINKHIENILSKNICK